MLKFLPHSKEHHLARYFFNYCDAIAHPDRVMAAQLASFVGKRIMKENVKNKFGQEVRIINNIRLYPWYLPTIYTPRRIPTLSRSLLHVLAEHLAKKRENSERLSHQACPRMTPKSSTVSSAEHTDSIILFSTYVVFALGGDL